MENNSVFSDERCSYCDSVEVEKANILVRNLSRYMENKAFNGCWDFVLGPLTNYVSHSVYLSPQLLRYLLNSVESVESSHCFQIQTLLDMHSLCHPPCRPGMPEYYSSVLFEHMTSDVFDETALKDSFWGLFPKIDRLLKTTDFRLETDEKPKVAVPTTKKEAVDFIKTKLKQCKIKNLETENNNRNVLEALIFVLNFIVKILSHDFFAFESKINEEPLMVKMWSSDSERFWGLSMEVFHVFNEIPEEYRWEVGRFVVLLWHVCSIDLASKKKFVESFIEVLDGDGATTRTAELVRDIPSDKLKHEIGAEILCRRLIENANHEK